jgi:MSHA biogenesis protein MshJ
MKAVVRTLWKRRSARERVLVVLALLALVVAALDTALLAPQRADRARALREATAARTQVRDLQALVTEQSREGDAQFAERSDALRLRRERAEQVIRAAQVDLIEPADMREQLAAILARFPQLKVVAVASTPPTPLGEAVGAGKDAAPVTTGVFQHGLEVQIEGRYLDLIAYLEALETTPRRIYWRELDLTINPQGVPVTRIALFTLSKEPVWMRI